MTRAQIISAAKSRYKQTTTELDTLIGDWVDEGYRLVTKQFGWKEAIVRNASQALTAGTEAYNLPAAFFRMVDNSVRFYRQAYTTQQADRILPYIKDDQVGFYQSMFDVQYPLAYTISSSITAGRKSLLLLPQFTATGAYVYYDYYSRPDDYDTADTNNTPDLSDYLIYYTLARMAEYFEDDRFSSYNQLAREHRNAIFQEINNG